LRSIGEQQQRQDANRRGGLAAVEATVEATVRQDQSVGINPGSIPSLSGEGEGDPAVADREGEDPAVADPS
jgi:hypothetical protein